MAESRELSGTEEDLEGRLTIIEDAKRNAEKQVKLVVDENKAHTETINTLKKANQQLDDEVEDPRQKH
jgi:predicted  nucleic acid-binding Zn-ribbon protein